VEAFASTFGVVPIRARWVIIEWEAASNHSVETATANARGESGVYTAGYSRTYEPALAWTSSHTSHTQPL
jgi:hypothetical protein